MTNKTFLIFVWAISFLPYVSAELPSHSTDGSLYRFRSEMKSLLGTDEKIVRFIEKRDVLTIEFCPDNSCHSFSTQGSREKLFDFVYLFEASIPTFYALEKGWKKQDQTIAYADLLSSKYQKRSGCGISPSDRMSESICVLRYLEKSEKISLAIVRYDEGRRSSSPTKLNEFLQKSK